MAALLAGAPAQARVTHKFRSRITEVPVFGPLEETVPRPGPIESPISLTVDQGHLWDAEFEHNNSWRTDEFGVSSEDFIAQLPREESLAYVENGIAVGHKTGETELYVGADSYPEGGGPTGSVAVFNEAHELQAIWTGADTPNGEGFGCFDCSGSGNVAVDNSVGDWAEGDVYVASPEHDVVDVFKPEAGGKEKYVTQITGVSPTEPLEKPETVAVDQADGDVLIGGGGKVDIFEPTLEPEYQFLRSITGTPNGPFSQTISGLAVGGGEQDGDIYVGIGGYVNAGTIDQFNYEGVYLGQLTGRSPSEPFVGAVGIAVDPETPHDVFIGERGAIDIFEPDLVIPDVSTDAPSNVRAHSATLNGTVKTLRGQTGEGANCAFMWGETTEELTHEAKCEPEEASGEENAVHATLSEAAQSELQPDTTYYYLLKASNKNGLNPGEPIQIQQFTTPGPKVESASVTEVTNNSVSFHAAIKPHGAPTSYYFEYSSGELELGSSCSKPCTVVPAEPGPAIGSGESTVDVGQPPVEALQVDTTYHYRVVAVSELLYGTEKFESPEATFTTQPVGGPRELPDDRQWELVTPPDEHGALVLGVDQLFEAGLSQAADNGNAVAVVASSPLEKEPEGHSETEALLATRQSTGWTSRVLTPPHANAPGPSIGQGPEYRFFSEDLSRAVLQPFGNFYPLSPEAITFTPYLRTNFYNGNANDLCEGAVDTAQSCYTPLLTAADSPGLQAGSGVCPGLICGTGFEGASPDGSHIIIGGLEEWFNGKLVPVGIPPASEAGESYGGSLGGVGFNPHATRAVSTDGSRVVWSSGSERIYLRVNAMAPQSPAPGAKGSGSLIAAEGSGTLTRGSTSVTEVVAKGIGSFAAGQIITGPGIQAGTTITVASGTSLTLSAPATGSGRGVALRGGSNAIGSLVAAAGTGTLTSGSSEVTSLTTTTGQFVVGQPVAGEGLPSGTTVTAVGENSLTLSAAATASGSEVAISSEGPEPFQAGWPIVGEGIAPGTKITAVGPGRLTLSAPVMPVGSSVALSAGYECTDPSDACTFYVGTGYYETASTNDSVIYFTRYGALFRYDLEAPEGEHVTELAKGIGARAVIGTSEDGSYVYYVGGNQTLYVEHEGKETAIAKLSNEDYPDWERELSHMTARVSPNGHWVAFMSNEDLTGYDTDDAVTGEPDEEVYVYNALTNKLVCASCNPDGARPVGFPYESGGPSQISEADRVFESGQGIAAIVPPWTTNSKQELAQPRYLSNSGRAFFDSHDALVPQDVNGNVDVYEWQPAGVGSCASSSPTFSERTGGCIGLISSGSSPEESAFLSASETGGDVFFLTKAKLVPEAYETSLAVYDARECLEQSCYPPPVGTPPPCDNGDSCKPAPTPQPTIFGAPASATFIGAGNPPTVEIVEKAKTLTRAQKLAAALGACRKAKSKSARRTCERSARRRYGTKGSRKTKSGRAKGSRKPKKRGRK